MDTIISFPLILFMLITMISPGPNNLLTIVIIKKYGKKKAVIFYCAVITGVMAQFLVTIFGLSPFLANQNSHVHRVLSIVSSALLLYIAWKIATTKYDTKSVQEIPSAKIYYRGIVLQSINPKAWAFVISVSVRFVTVDSLFLKRVAVISASMVVMLILSGIVWILFGLFLSTYFQSERSHRITMRTLGILLAATVIWSLF